MTEAEWLACDDPAALLSLARPYASARKLRLLACACCRRVWRRLHRSWRPAVEAAELVADGRMRRADMLAKRPSDPATFGHAEAAASVASAARVPPIGHGFFAVLDHAADAEAWRTFSGAALRAGVAGQVAARRAARAAQARLVRDILGMRTKAERLTTPFSAALPPGVVSLARAAYEERQLPSGKFNPHRLALLADALEEAGTPGDLAAHLRGPGPHVRGCHVIDLCLGLT